MPLRGPVTIQGMSSAPACQVHKLSKARFISSVYNLDASLFVSYTICMPKDLELYREIGKIIYAHRTAKGRKMSQLKLAEAVGMSRASIANIERGHHRIQIHVLFEIAAALEVEIVTLLPTHSAAGAEHSLVDEFSKPLEKKELLAVGRLIKKREGATQ